ncbi:MAG: hypothetical protein R2747_02540 [Pyrinomonadaceae bacterium]
MKSEVSQIVGELNQRLLENHRNDSALFAELTDVQAQLGLLFDDRPTCPFLRPHLMPRTLYDEIARAAETIARAARRLADAALENREILEKLDVSEREEELARINPGYEKLCVTSRFDTFIGPDGFKFLEYNAETPAGVGDQMQLETVLGQIPEIREFLSDNRHWRPQPHQKLLRALFQTYRETGGKKSKPNIGIVDWEGVSTESEFYILKDYFESMGFRTLIIDPREIEYDGTTLMAGNFEIDIFYKRVLISELLEKFDDSYPLMRAYRDGNIFMANSFRVKLIQKKAAFALMTDEKYADLFTPEQKEMIDRHLPWTRRVEQCRTVFDGSEIDLIEFLRKNREPFLLKPNDDYGGKGIVLGWESSQSEWEAGLEGALADSFVVQQRAPIEKTVFPVFSESAELIDLLVDFDPFLFLDEIEGGMVRLSSSSLVNVTQGGGQTALIVLEDL